MVHVHILKLIVVLCTLLTTTCRYIHTNSYCTRHISKKNTNKQIPNTYTNKYNNKKLDIEQHILIKHITHHHKC